MRAVVIIHFINDMINYLLNEKGKKSETNSKSRDFFALPTKLLPCCDACVLNILHDFIVVI